MNLFVLPNPAVVTVTSMKVPDGYASPSRYGFNVRVSIRAGELMKRPETGHVSISK